MQTRYVPYTLQKFNVIIKFHRRDPPPPVTFCHTPCDPSSPFRRDIFVEWTHAETACSSSGDVYRHGHKPADPYT